MSLHPLLPRLVPYVFNAIQSFYDLQYYCVAATTFLYYDYILTLPAEVERIWRHKGTFVSALFLINRYLPIFGYIPIMIFIFDSINDPSACKRFSHWPGILNCISQIIICILLIMRVYALYWGKLWITILATILGLSTVILSGWSLTNVIADNFTFGIIGAFTSCVPVELRSNTSFLLSWILSLAFDITVFTATIMKTYRINREHKSARMKSDLASLLMRDGSIYFAVMAVANVVNFVLFFRSNTFFTESTGNNSLVTYVISVTMVSRLILNLRDESLQGDCSIAHTEFSSIGPHFPTMTDTIDEDMALSSWRERSSSMSFSSDGTRYLAQDTLVVGSQTHHLSLVSESATTLTLASPVDNV